MPKKYCEQCGKEYDANNYECPKCSVRNEAYPLDIAFKNMSWLAAWKQAVIMVIGYGGLQIFATLIAIILTSLGIQNEWYTLWCNTGAYILTLGAICFVLWDDLLPLLKKFTKLRPYIYGIAYGALLVAAGILYNYILLACNVKIDDSGNQKAIISIVKASPAVAFLMIVILGPLCEEFTYRIGLFNLTRRVNRIFAYIISMLIFGLIHFDFTSSNLINELYNLPSYIISGAILCYAYEKEGLACSTTTHVLNNLVSFISIVITMNSGN